MNVTVYYHRDGRLIVPEYQVEGIKDIISHINPLVRKNTVTEIRDDIVHGLDCQGWSGEYRLDTSSKITISSIQANVGLCLQTGNVSRIYADLLKLQALYLKGKIKAGIIIVPQKELAIQLASNMASFERLVSELAIFAQVISLPLVIIGFNVEG